MSDFVDAFEALTVREEPRCYRCHEVLEPDGSSKGLSFWKCQPCNWGFTRHEDGELTERWMGPLSLVLYGVMFDEEPVKSVDRVEAHLITDQLLDEISAELANPRQKVSRILTSRATEDATREFLRALLLRHRPMT